MVQKKSTTGSIIRQLRTAKGYGIRDMERLTGINRGNLSKIERGAGFGPLQISRIATQLETTPAVILILSEILDDRDEFLENAQRLSDYCTNLTRLLHAFQASPEDMQIRLENMLTTTPSMPDLYRVASS